MSSSVAVTCEEGWRIASGTKWGRGQCVLTDAASLAPRHSHSVIGSSVSLKDGRRKKGRKKRKKQEEGTERREGIKESAQKARFHSSVLDWFE